MFRKLCVAEVMRMAQAKTNKKPKARTTRKEAEKQKELEIEVEGQGKPIDEAELAAMVDDLIRALGKRLKGKTKEESLHEIVGDLHRLLQMHRELAPEILREVTVQWIGNEKSEPHKD
jgi:hypothetical protein